MLRKVYVALWNFQLRHTTPRWVCPLTGEVVSHIGKIMSGRFLDKSNRIEYSWVPLESGR